jgi:hypothetical protein
MELVDDEPSYWDTYKRIVKKATEFVNYDTDKLEDAMSEQ